MIQSHIMGFLESEQFAGAKNPEALTSVDDDEVLLLVGFGFTDPKSIAKFHEMVSQNTGKKAVGRSKEATNLLRLRDVGGAITLISLNPLNPKDTEILADFNVSVPMGLCYRPQDKTLYVGSHESVIALKNGGIDRHLHNNLFSDIHTVNHSPRGLYVVCTATDSIVEIDPENPSFSLWDWLATEHGFTIAPNGERITVDRNTVYKDVEGNGTRAHTTHINGVEKLDENHLLATLFHQDALIQIDLTTGDYKIALDGFTNPHGIHKISDGFILSDTRGGRVVFLDPDLKIVKEIKDEFKWIQDSIEFKNHYLVADDNQATIFVYDKSLKCTDQIKWDHGMRKISVVIQITAKEAKNIFLNN